MFTVSGNGYDIGTFSNETRLIDFLREMVLDSLVVYEWEWDRVRREIAP